MTIHDEARAASEAVYDAEISRYSLLLGDAEIKLSQLQKENQSLQGNVESLLSEIGTLKARIAELESEKDPAGWVSFYDSTFEKNDGWTLRQETQSNDNSYNTPKNVLFGDGMTIVSVRS